MMRRSAKIVAADHTGSRSVNTQLLYVGLMAMHHIYCSEKKACILDSAGEYNLRGLYQFGKPGRVVIEGDEESVRKYIRAVSRCGHWQICKDMGSMYSYEALGMVLEHGNAVFKQCPQPHAKHKSPSRKKKPQLDADTSLLAPRKYPASSISVFPSDFGFQPSENDDQLRDILQLQLGAQAAYETVSRPFNAPRIISCK